MNWKMKFGRSWGRLGMKFRTYTMEDALEQIIDYRGKTPIKVKEGIPLITAKNIKKGYINEEPREYIEIKNYEKWMTRGIPEKGDIAITTEAPLGNVAQLNFENKFALAQRIITLTDIKLNKKYLFFSLLTPYFQIQLKKYSTGSTVEGIKSKSLKLYLFSFRNHGDFHEDCVNIIMKDLIKLMDPKYIEVWGKFTPRGGISIDPYTNYGKQGTMWEQVATDRLVHHDLYPEKVDNR